jgi:hypothetical protein
LARICCSFDLSLSGRRPVWKAATVARRPRRYVEQSGKR